MGDSDAGLNKKARREGTPDSFARSLADSLLASSQKFSVSALEGRLEGKNEFFLLHAAVALEQLAKATLAAKHPSLIAADDFDTLLHTAGQSMHAHRPPQLMKSISMDKALDRCSRLVPGVHPSNPKLQRLRDVRNGVAHLGESPEEADELLVPYLEVTRMLLANVDVSLREYFGEQYSTVEEVLRKAGEKTEDDVRTRVAAAKEQFEKRFEGIADPEWMRNVRSMTVATTVTMHDLDRLERQLYPCPACQTPALVEGMLEPDYEFDEEVEDGVFSVHGSLVSLDFYPHELMCNACGLELVTSAEVEAAGVPDSWTLEEFDENLFREWELHGWDDV